MTKLLSIRTHPPCLYLNDRTPETLNRDILIPIFCAISIHWGNMVNPSKKGLLKFINPLTSSDWGSQKEMETYQSSGFS